MLAAEVCQHDVQSHSKSQSMLVPVPHRETFICRNCAAVKSKHGCAGKLRCEEDRRNNTEL